MVRGIPGDGKSQNPIWEAYFNFKVNYFLSSLKLVEQKCVRHSLKEKFHRNISEDNFGP